MTVLSKKKRTSSSRRWLQRQLSDPYVKRAVREGYRSRSAFKLIEMNDRRPFIHPGSKIIDLGCAPGGWCQVAADLANVETAGGLVIGLDLLEIAPIPGCTLIQGDAFSSESEAEIRALLNGAKVDVVLSDMVAPTIGNRKADSLRAAALCERAAQLAACFLGPSGVLLAKVLRGGAEGDLLARLKRDYEKVIHVKPAASRAESREIYMLASRFRAQNDEQSS